MEKLNKKQIDTLKSLVLHKLDRLISRRDNLYTLCLEYPDNKDYQGRYDSLSDSCNFYEELYKSI